MHLRKYIAEFIGTFTLVLIGCGAAVVAGDQIGFVGIAFAFGLALVAMAYAIGPLTGCHINPAVSLSFFTAGRMNGRDLLGYIIAQLLGGLAGAAVLLALVTGRIEDYSLALQGLGQNGWGFGYQGGYNQMSAIIYEFVGTLLFVLVILGATQKEASKEAAGLAIGLTLVALHLIGINITGTSVNPARSFGPALLVGGQALSQLWLFLLIPSIAGLVGGFLSRLIVVDEYREFRPGGAKIQPQ